MSRGTRAILRPDALRQNLSVLRQLAASSRVMAVVKANAYGHGIENVVSALHEVDGFAVATLCEAARVRDSGAAQPVLLLEGVTSSEELEQAGRLGLEMTVHSEFQIRFLEDYTGPDRFRVWLKIDTGMHRLGFDRKAAGSVLARLQALDCLAGDPVLMSHLANADDLDDDKTSRQAERFDALREQLGLRECSLANSAGAVAWPETRNQWVRAGLVLYGASPLAGRRGTELGLAPVMTLRSTLIAINACRRGDAIGYGGHFRCQQDMPVGIVAIGYGDGYPRHAPNGTPVLVNGKRCPLVGRVSMDMLSVNLSGVPDARVGDEVILWGDGLPVESIAKISGTIPYELLCGVTARVPSEIV